MPQVEAQNARVSAAAVTDPSPGLKVRAVADPERGRYLVAEGVGGDGVAECAAADVLRAVAHAANLEAGLEAANTQLQALRSQPESNKAGASVVAAQIQGLEVLLAHVGDGRAFLVHAGAVTLLTEDHTLANQLLRLRQLTAEQARTHAARRTLTRYVGKEAAVRLATRTLTLSPDDVLVLASREAADALDDARLIGLAKADDLDQAARALVEGTGAGGALGLVAVRASGAASAPDAGTGPGPATEALDRMREIVDRLLGCPAPEAELATLAGDLLAVALEAAGASSGALVVPGDPERVLASVGDPVPVAGRWVGQARPGASCVLVLPAPPTDPADAELRTYLHVADWLPTLERVLQRR